MTSAAADSIRTEADALAANLVAWRRWLHENPELAFEEVRTSRFVADRLEELGLEPTTGIARTGVAAVLRARDATGAAVLLRADMDALPLEEHGGREYGSKVPGRMHACGHDGHMAMLLGAATLLTRRRDSISRDVVLCFQPAEEGGGGARAMIDAGVLDLAPTGEAYALHLWSPFPAGTLHVRPGPIMAGNDEFTARFLGKGGHGAQPHLAVDPIVAAAQGIVAIQGVVSRSVDPLEPAVVTVGSVHAGTAPNVIPDAAVLEGTMRSFRPEVRQRLRARVREALEGAATGAGCRLDWELREGYPTVVNDARAVERVRSEGARVFGAANVHEPAPLAAAEDFAYFLERVPGAFVLVGAGNAERGITAPHHSPRFDIDETVLPRGAELLARLALAA
jgi:amidohydrolase